MLSNFKILFNVACIASRFVPRTLNLLQKQQRAHVAREIFSQGNCFLKRFITDDET